MTHYIFYGRILPERADVFLIQDSIELKKPIKAQLIVKCERSKLVVEYKDNAQSANLLTLKNLIEAVARQLVDSVGYMIVCGYDVEIESAYNISTQELMIFGVQEEIFDLAEDLERIRKGRPPAILEQGDQIINYAIIFSIIGTDISLQLALAEFRESIKRPHYTAAHCFNVIEALGESKLLDDCKDKKRINLQNKLKVTKKTIDKICKYGGNVQRHIKCKKPDEWINSIDWERRKEQMSITWEIIRRYIMLHKYPEELEKLSEL